MRIICVHSMVASWELSGDHTSLAMPRGLSSSKMTLPSSIATILTVPSEFRDRREPSGDHSAHDPVTAYGSSSLLNTVRFSPDTKSHRRMCSLRSVTVTATYEALTSVPVGDHFSWLTIVSGPTGSKICCSTSGVAELISKQVCGTGACETELALKVVKGTKTRPVIKPKT